MKIGSYIFILLSAFVFVQCAQQYAVSGGEKDTRSPILDTTKTNAFPPNYSTNFSGNEIKLVFDEFVKLDNPETNVIISPPFSKI